MRWRVEEEDGMAGIRFEFQLRISGMCVEELTARPTCIYSNHQLTYIMSLTAYGTILLALIQTEPKEKLVAFCAGRPVDQSHRQIYDCVVRCHPPDCTHGLTGLCEHYSARVR